MFVLPNYQSTRFLCQNQNNNIIIRLLNSLSIVDVGGTLKAYEATTDGLLAL